MGGQQHAHDDLLARTDLEVSMRHETTVVKIV